MRVLFDQGTPVPLRAWFPLDTVRTAAQESWHTLSNGDLLTAAETAGFDVLLTTDKNLRYQQHLTGRTIAIVVLRAPQWPIEPRTCAQIAAAVCGATAGQYLEVG